MEKFIATNPEIWYEDIGLPAESAPISTPPPTPRKVALVTGAGSGIGEGTISKKSIKKKKVKTIK